MKKILIFTVINVFITILFTFCKKDNNNPNIEIETISASEITQNSAMCGGFISNDGGNTIIERGVCWSININPTINDYKTIDGAGAGHFAIKLLNLFPNTNYYIRAYATNSIGTAYGNAMAFKTDTISVPTIETTPLQAFTKTTAIFGGIINNENGSKIISKGLSWYHASIPTASNMTIVETDLNEFSSEIANLETNTKYFVRAYAINEAGVGYGEEMEFVTQGIEGVITDNEGNEYITIEIGTQTWMVENLRTSSYNNSDPIETTDPILLDISSENEPKYQWVYNGIEENSKKYGRYYTWNVVSDARGIAPNGWHVPSSSEWNTLIEYLGGNEKAGGKLKQQGNSFWNEPNIFGTNESGFTAIGSGYRLDWGFFNYLGDSGGWWSSTSGLNSDALYVYVRFDHSMCILEKNPIKNGFTVRCIKD